MKNTNGKNQVKDWPPTSPKKEPLTIEKLRTFKGLENLSDEDAQEMLFQIEALCAILMEALELESNSKK